MGGHGQIRLPEQQARRMFETISENQSDVKTLRAYAKLRLLSRGRAYQASVAVVLERPDWFRIEFLTPFGQPRFIVAFDGENLSQSGETDQVWLERDEASGDSRLSWLGLSPEWLVSAALGLPPIDTSAMLSLEGFDEGRRGVMLNVKTEEAEAAIWVKKRSDKLDVERFKYSPKSEDSPVVEISYAKFIDVPGADGSVCRVPQVITIGVPARHEGLRIDFEMPELNLDLDASLFHVGRRVP